MSMRAAVGGEVDPATEVLAFIGRASCAESVDEVRAALSSALKAANGVGGSAGGRIEETLNALAATREAYLRAEEAKSRRIRHLETYQTISSVVAQPLGLHELMENTMYCCMDVFNSEGASVLLLDEIKQNFEFYQAEGAVKELLSSFRIPITQGIAGHTLRTGQSEVINDVQSDPRFFRNIDRETSFVTRQMIVTPLIAGQEKVGVLEVINKIDGSDFTEDERTLLEMLAEEIAFAIRNARVFELVVDSYCKQRQGLNTCRGCKRPLGSWTPCVKFADGMALE